VTGFLFESIESNPLVTKCGYRCCSLDEQIARISFLLKSIEALPEEYSLSIQGLLEPVVREIVAANIMSRLQSDDSNQAVEDLLAILTNQPQQTQALINPDVISLLQNSTDPAFHANDILSASTGNFEVKDDPLVFIRPYLLSFQGASAFVDILASFYAGLEPIDYRALESLFQDCAAVSVGLEWSKVAPLHTSSGSTCEQAFVALYNDFNATRDDSFPTRLDDFVGETIRTMVPTSVLGGDGVGLWEQAIVDYESINLPIDFTPDFSDTRFGYFGDDISLQRAMDRLPILFDNEKTNRFIPLGTQTWRTILLTSPAEPTLSR